MGQAQGPDPAPGPPASHPIRRWARAIVPRFSSPLAQGFFKGVGGVDALINSCVGRDARV